MNRKTAIRTLENQINKLQNISDIAEGTWTTQTRSFVAAFFGDTSDEYQFIKTFSFQNHFYDTATGNYVLPDNSIHVKTATTFLNDCIYTIKVKGLKKREWKHILITTNPALFWSILCVFVTGVFLFGKSCNTTNERDGTANQVSADKNDKAVHNKDLSSLRTDTTTFK